MKYFNLLLVLLMMVSLSAVAELHQGQYILNGNSYRLDIAQTPQQLLKGLMGRKELAQNEGMLLVFPELKPQGIWMKNMQIPLTVAWLNEAYQVIQVRQLQPCGNQYCPVYFSTAPARFVLELAVNSNVRVGDQLFYQTNTLSTH